jgi:HD-like signal output (HDOD) protein/ActR/RegA family two-component response regulator
MAKRILFVDDEPMILAGLERSLRTMRKDWDMVFVTSGREALEAMAGQTFDIVVTDMRMPGMDGAQLLEEVKKRSPQSLRMILSGQSDRETILRSVNPTHQYLSKPCEGEELKSRLMRAFALKDLLENPELKGLVSRLDSLPSLPALYLQLTEELQRPEPSLAKVAKLISADIAMTAKVLQLVNSAFFGLRCQVSKAYHAVELLGTDIVRALILSTHVFSKFETDLLSEADVQYLWQHSLATASYAKRIAVQEHCPQRLVDDCFTAALLHDAGKLIMAFALRPQYKSVLELVKGTGRGLNEAEREVLGCGHPEIGAYLFGLWGLPGPIVEAVAWHHQPGLSLQAGFSAVAAVHVASIYHEQKTGYWMKDQTEIDHDFLSRIGCQEREPVWRKTLEGEEAQGAEHERQNPVCG